MKVLVSESKNKQTQIIKDIQYETIYNQIKENDMNYHEVIDAGNPNQLVRIYFDIDDYQNTNPLQNVMELINTFFNCENEDWAISDGSREGKWSYHILSKKYKISIQKLRDLTSKFKEKHISFDYSSLCISMESINDYIFLRFPNQSKHSINKPAPPMKIIQGELKDFFINQTSNLQMFT